eukprot:214770_1
MGFATPHITHSVSSKFCYSHTKGIDLAIKCRLNPMWYGQHVTSISYAVLLCIGSCDCEQVKEQFLLYHSGKKHQQALQHDESTKNRRNHHEILSKEEEYSSQTFTKPHDVSGQSKVNTAYIFIQVCDTNMHQNWNL